MIARGWYRAYRSKLKPSFYFLHDSDQNMQESYFRKSFAMLTRLEDLLRSLNVRNPVRWVFSVACCRTNGTRVLESQIHLVSDRYLYYCRNEEKVLLEEYRYVS